MKYEKKYVIIPTSFKSPMKQILFSKNGSVFFKLDAQIADENAEFISYASLPCSLGDEIECTVDGKLTEFSQSDKMELDNLYREPHRPRVHFTVANGWNNDPNGMIKFGDTYHMFYQYNPCSTGWGNMHWGHATSDNMLCWKEQDVALYPDALGTMYSGSAIEKDGKMFLFYTAAGDHSYLETKPPFTQCLAISNDGGKTFEKYENNPIIKNIGAGNRDPKVVYSNTLGCYLMALYLDEGAFPKSFGYYAFLKSDDLYNWDFICRFEIPNDFECPDILIFKRDGRELYALMGASGKYIIGEFVNGAFLRLTDGKALFDPCIDYAGQSFFGIEDRTVRIGWQRIGAGCSRFSQQMGIPIEISLIGDDADLRLVSSPVREISELYTDVIRLGEISCGYELSLQPDAYDISIECDGALTISIFGKELVLGAGSARIIIDTCSIELWQGEFYTVIAHTASDSPFKHLSGAKIKTASFARLKNIH